MKIDSELINRLAELARLNFDDKRAEEIRLDLSKMLEFVESLNQVDTEGIEPLTYVNETINVLREDKQSQEISKEDALRNVPKKDSDFIKVPKVIKKA